MAHFIKTGFWEKAEKGFKGWLNLDQLIQQLSPGGGVWGSITGVLSNQIDLQNSLDSKQDDLGYTAENSANKVGTISASASQYPNNNAVIAYTQPAMDAVNRMTSITLLSVSGAVAINNMAVAEIELNGSTGNRVAFDGTYFTQARLTTRVITLSGSLNNPRLYAQWSTDETVWTTLGTGLTTQAVLLSSAGLKRTDFITLPAGAKADVYWRIVTIGGDAAADPGVNNIILQFK